MRYVFYRKSSYYYDIKSGKFWHYNNTKIECDKFKEEYQKKYDEISNDVIIDLSRERAVVVAQERAGDEDHHCFGLFPADLLAVDRDQALLHDLAPFAKFRRHHLPDLFLVVAEDIGLGRGVRAQLALRRLGDVVHEVVHECQI